MEIASTMPPPEGAAAEVADVLAQFYSDACNRFLQWQKAYLLDQEPSAGVLKAHRHNTSLLIHMGRLLEAELADPDPHASTARDVAGKLHQLEQSWEMFHNPMAGEESNTILKKCFPDEPSFGSAA